MRQIPLPLKPLRLAVLCALLLCAGCATAPGTPDGLEAGPTCAGSPVRPSAMADPSDARASDDSDSRDGHVASPAGVGSAGGSTPADGADSAGGADSSDGAASIWSSGSVRIAPGEGEFTFVDALGNADRPIKVYYYCPPQMTPDTPIVFVMHGTLRDGREFRDHFARYARRCGFLLLVPTFEHRYYPMGNQYERGYLYSLLGTRRPKAKWTYWAIEHLFDAVVAATASRQESYCIYGHSAGGQFVHRMVTLLPEARIDRAIAANAGWYMLPELGETFPYGCRGVVKDPQALSRAMSVDLVVLVGGNDTDPRHGQLYNSPRACAQGPHRLARGANYLRAAQMVADQLGVDLKWRMKTVPGVAHNNPGMAAAAMRELYPELE